MIPRKSKPFYNVYMHSVHTNLCTNNHKCNLRADGSVSDISAHVIQALPFQARNYYKSVAENKEIVKLVSVLSTSISSTKKVYSITVEQEHLIEASYCTFIKL